MPSAIDWKPVTWPSTRQGVISTLLTILPGQEAGGVSAVWPRTVTVSGAESAEPGSHHGDQGDEQAGPGDEGQGGAAAVGGRNRALSTWQHPVGGPVAAPILPSRAPRCGLDGARCTIWVSRGAFAVVVA